MLPQTFRGYEIASETIFGQTTGFHMYDFLLHLPIRRTTLVSAFRSFANLTSHTHYR